MIQIGMDRSDAEFEVVGELPDGAIEALAMLLLAAGEADHEAEVNDHRSDDREHSETKTTRAGASKRP